MVIFLKPDGSALNVAPERIFQGSNNVVNVYVIAPYTPSTALEIAFTLPDNSATEYRPMSYVTRIESGEAVAGAWLYTLREPVTTMSGTVYININAVTAQGNRTSYSVNFDVEPAILPSLPPTPEPDVYELLLLYIQQNSNNIISLDKRVSDLERTTFRKVLVDFSVNPETGQGVKYYSDGTTAEIQFPTGGSEPPPVKSSFINVLTFTEESFNVDNELAFSPEQTGFTDSRYLALIDRTGANGDAQGYWQTANTFFKGTDGSIYMRFNKPFAGRLVLLGGILYTGEFIISVEYDELDNTFTFHNANGTETRIVLPRSETRHYNEVILTNDWTVDGARFAFVIPQSEHKCGELPIVFSGNKHFDVAILDNGDVYLRTSVRTTANITIV